MKIQLDKNKDLIRLEVHYDASKKPVILNIEMSQLDGLLRAVETVRGLEKVKLLLEV